MFDRAHHERIQTILNRMNQDLMVEAEAYFGGGTAIVMELGEYRESVDIDFLCSSRAGYAALRTAFHHGNFNALFPEGVTQEGDFVADQYGIRGWVSVDDDRDVKFEIIRESRIDLFGARNDELGVLQLDRVCMYCEKLLANVDRGLDRVSLNRDAMDLLMMERRWGPLPERSREMAIEAYGESVMDAYERSLNALGSRKWLDRCCEEMEISDAVRDELIEQLGGRYRDDRFTGFDY